METWSLEPVPEIIQQITSGHVIPFINSSVYNSIHVSRFHTSFLVINHLKQSYVWI